MSFSSFSRSRCRPIRFSSFFYGGHRFPENSPTTTKQLKSPKNRNDTEITLFLAQTVVRLVSSPFQRFREGGGSGHCNIIRLNSCYDFDLTQVRVSLSSGRMCTHRWGFHWLRKLKPEDSSNPENSIQGFWWFCFYSNESSGPYLTSYLTWVILS